MTKNVAYPIGNVDPGHCVWCGVEAPLNQRNGKLRKFCSDVCRNHASEFRRKLRAVSGEKVDRPTHCVICGGDLPQLTRPGNPRKYCSKKCENERSRRAHDPETSRVAYEKHRAEQIADNAVKYAGAKCEHCGGETRWSDLGVPRRFCSVKCQRRSRYERHLAENLPCSVDGCDRPQHCGGLCSSHWSRKWNDEHPDAAWRSRAEYRARKRAATVEQVSREAVLERDHWRCGICGEQISQDAVWPDVRSASIDHVVPLNAGGDHSMANCQAAHYGCNASKKDAGGGEQLALIG